MNQLTSAELKEQLALNTLINPSVMSLMTDLCSSDREFLKAVILNYHKVDTKAVFGAEHVFDFIKNCYITASDFSKLAELTDRSVYKFAMLMRMMQLGFTNQIALKAWLEDDVPADTIVPFNFKDLEILFLNNHPQLLKNNEI